MNIEVLRDSSAIEFMKNVTSFLHQHEPVNSLMLGLCHNLAKFDETVNPSALFIRVMHAGAILTAAVQAPGRNLILTYAEEPELRQLADYLWECDAELPGVVGPSEVVDTFTRIWSGLSGKTASLVMRMGVFKIESVRIPVVHGTLSLAGARHVPIVAEWMVAFGDESLPHKERLGIKACLIAAQRIVDNGGAYFWVVDGDPVSMVHVARQTQNGASLNAVFTPKEKRNRGYASAAVAHLSQQLLNSGKRFCVLYTDSSNPTSNKVYNSVGYRQVGDSKNYQFS